MQTLFGAKPAEQAPQQQQQAPAAPGNLQDTPIVAGQEGNGVVPAQAPAAAPKEPDSPLDAYKELWDTAPTDPNKPSATPAALDPAKLQELVGKADFTNTVTPELMTAIEAGGEGATAAMMQVMNLVAQQSMVQSTLAGNKLLETKIKSVEDNQAAIVAEAIRKQMLNNNLVEANPVFSNPAVKPVIEAVQAQLAEKNPNATPAELTVMAQNFVTTMSESLNPNQQSADANVAKADDWSKFVPNIVG